MGHAVALPCKYIYILIGSHTGKKQLLLFLNKEMIKILDVI